MIYSKMCLGLIASSSTEAGGDHPRFCNEGLSLYARNGRRKEEMSDSRAVIFRT